MKKNNSAIAIFENMSMKKRSSKTKDPISLEEIKVSVRPKIEHYEVLTRKNFKESVEALKNQTYSQDDAVRLNCTENRSNENSDASVVPLPTNPEITVTAIVESKEQQPVENTPIPPVETTGYSPAKKRRTRDPASSNKTQSWIENNEILTKKMGHRREKSTSSALEVVDTQASSTDLDNSSQKSKTLLNAFKKSTTGRSDKFSLLKKKRKLRQSPSNNSIVENNSTNYFGLALNSLIIKFNQKIPMFIFNLIETIEQKGFNVSGIYRESGSASIINNIINFINNCNDSDFNLNQFENNDIHIFANVFKQFIREIPDSLIPDPYCEQLIELQRNNEDISEISKVLARLPLNNRAILLILLTHLKEISKYSEENLMDPYNIGICFAPSIMAKHNVTNFIDFNIKNNLLAKIIINLNSILDDQIILIEVFDLIPAQLVGKYSHLSL